MSPVLPMLTNVVVLSVLVWSAGAPGVLMITPPIALLAAELRRTDWLAKCSIIWKWIVGMSIGGIVAVLTLFLWREVPEPPRLVTGWLTTTLAVTLVYKQLLVWLFRTDHQTLPAVIPAMGMVIVACAFNQTITSSDYYFFLPFGIVSVLLIAWQFSRISRFDSVLISERRKTVALVLGITVVVTWSVAGIWHGAVVKAQSELTRFLGQRTTAPTIVENYPNTGFLGAITWAQLVEPDGIALRVYCDRTPGYLRGRVFDTYDQWQWRLASHRRGQWNRLKNKIVSEAMDQPPTQLGIDSREQSCFELRKNRSKFLVRMEIHNDPQRGEMFFSPLDTVYLAGRGKQVVLDEYGVVYGGIAAYRPYTVWVERGSYPQSNPWQPPLSAAERKRLLSPLGELSPAVEDLAAEVCQNSDSASQKIAAVTRFFHQNFKYTQHPVGGGSDKEPISHFLLTRHPAHCECFASGAIAILRLQGVPARYVTGYRVTEIENDDEEYFLARNRDAHAWVEAYDDDARQWVIVEATPGYTIPDEQVLDAQNNRAVNAQNATDMAISMGRWWRRWLATLTRLTVPWILIPGAVILVCLGWFAISRWRLRREDGCSDLRRPGNPRQLDSMDRKLRKRNLIRQRSETLHQFAHRIRPGEDQDPWLNQCAAWYVNYANQRYSGSI